MEGPKEFNHKVVMLKLVCLGLVCVYFYFIFIFIGVLY